MTRGRTGSTAIIDEMNKVQGIFTSQELFIKQNFKKRIRNDPGFKERMGISLDRYKKSKATIPYYLWKTQVPWQGKGWRRVFIPRARWVASYLYEMETVAKVHEASVFGFKVLSHHFDQTPSLKKVLSDHKYQVIYLTRNVPRQVISGMIAKQRGAYNRKNYHDNTRYQIDLDEFVRLVKYSIKGVQDDLLFINSCGFDFIKVSYEEFTFDRAAFFEQILAFLGVPFEVPKASDYSVMIKDLRHTVENLDAVLERASAIGVTVV